LQGVIGSKDIRIHVSPQEDMNFIKKNFVYRSLAFDEFIRRASNQTNDEFFLANNEKYYLRSLGNDERKDVSDIK
jgi:tRNA wybutosine-synthesizing protein 5